jgi:hypothetical protein
MRMFQRVFQAIGQRPSSIIERHMPMINSIATSAGSYIYETNQMQRKKALMSWYKSIPELCGFVNKVARDMTAEWKFSAAISNSADDVGRNKIKKANQFSQEILLRGVLFSQAVDMLVPGEGYGWIGQISDDIARQVIAEYLESNLKPIGLELKETDRSSMAASLLLELKERQRLARARGIDEDALLPRKYLYLPSTTVENVYDDYDFKYYRHLKGGKEVLFTKEEVIRFTLMDVDGKPNGFSCVDSLLVQLELLRFMWQNMMSIHKNGGTMDKIVSFEGVNPNSEQWKKVREEFLKYKNIENRHGLYLTTGKFSAEDLTSIEEMQFKDMGLYITGLMALQWGLPRSAIPYILGEANSKADSGGEAERSYWECIRHMQCMFAERMNTQLWIPHFGVQLEFVNRFVHKDIQNQTYRMNLLDNLVKENELLTSIGKQLDDGVLLEALGRSDEDTKKASTRLMDQTMPKSTIMGNQPKRTTVSDSDVNKRAAKRGEQQSRTAARGTKPTGYGKDEDGEVFEPIPDDHDWTVEYKQMIGAEVQDVDLGTFVRIYQEDKQYHPGKPPRLFMRQNDQFRSYTFKSSDFVYRTYVRNDEMDKARVMLMNLGEVYAL